MSNTTTDRPPLIDDAERVRLKHHGIRLNRDGEALGVRYYEPIHPMNMDAALLADEMNEALTSAKGRCDE